MSFKRVDETAESQAIFSGCVGRQQHCPVGTAAQRSAQEPSSSAFTRWTTCRRPNSSLRRTDVKLGAGGPLAFVVTDLAPGQGLPDHPQGLDASAPAIRPVCSLWRGSFPGENHDPPLIPQLCAVDDHLAEARRIPRGLHRRGLGHRLPN